MRKKRKSKVKTFKRKSNDKFAKFKLAVESYIGKINWTKVGTFALVVLILVASKGALGPKAQIIASGIVDLALKANIV